MLRRAILPCLALVLLAAAPLAGQSTDPDWSEFVPGTLAQIQAAEASAIHDATTDGIRLHTILSPRSYPTRLTLTFDGDRRPLTPTARRVINEFAFMVARDSTYAKNFTFEYRFHEGKKEWWLPVQTVLQEGLGTEVHPGEVITLYTRWAGTELVGRKATWIFVVNGWRAGGTPTPPSLLEVNGFLLGQELRSVESALGKPFQTIPYPDGWVDRVYGLDRIHNEYMVFKTDSLHPDRVISIQIAGRPGSVMIPFLGLLLGATRDSVDAHLGAPTKVTRESDLAIDLLEYAGRNYTVEVDSTGRLSSIQVLGYEGLKESPDSGDPDPLERFRRSLATMQPDSLLALLAGDIEFYRDSTVFGYLRSPREDITDSGSPVHRELEALRNAVGKNADHASLRVTVGGPTGWVYKWESGPLAEAFFAWVPGGYRLYEVRWR